MRSHQEVLVTMLRCMFLSGFQNYVSRFGHFAYFMHENVHILL